jgi:hypothetical protein
MTLAEKKLLRLTKVKMIGCTEITLKDRGFSVGYAGNMGSSVKDLNDDLKLLTGLKDSVNFWKNHEMIKSFKETGDYGYYYSITFYLKNRGKKTSTK